MADTKSITSHQSRASQRSRALKTPQRPNYRNQPLTKHMMPVPVGTSQPVGQAVMAVPAHLFVPIYPAIPGIPAGLEALHFANGIGIHQELDPLELILPVEMSNRYSIHNGWGQRIYYAAESTDCCTRQCCGDNRQFKVIVYDSRGKEVMLIERQCGCELCCWGGAIGGSVVTVSLAKGGPLLGTVVQDCNYCSPKYHIDDAQGKTRARIQGDSCTACCASCSSVRFLVFDFPTGSEISRIERHFKFSNFFTDSVDSFGMLFSDKMDVEMKAALLGAVICIDFNFFEQNRGFGDNNRMSCTGLNCCIAFGFMMIVGAIVFVLYWYTDHQSSTYSSDS